MTYFQKNKHLSKAVLCIIIIMICWMPLSALSDIKEQKEEKSKLSEPHLLSNEDLLKQTQTILDKASENFFTQLRGFYGIELQLKEARKKTASLPVPEKQPSSEGMDTVKAAKAEVDYAKSMLDTCNLTLERIQAEKTLLDKQINQLETTQSAASVFINAIDGLNPFLLEIRLRMEDKTLMPDKIPDSLKAQKPKMQKQKIILLQHELRQKAEALRKEMDDTVSLIEKAKKSVVEAETAHDSVKKKYSLELNRKTIEDEYSGLTKEKLLSQVPKLQEEQIWLQSAFNLSYRQFQNSQKAIRQMQEQIEKALPTETEQTLQAQTEMNAEETEKITLSAEKIIAYHTERIKMLKDLSTVIKSMIKHGELFEGDATVLNAHLFKMQVIAKILKGFTDNGKMKYDEIPENIRSEVLTSAADAASKLVSETLTAIQKAGEQIVQINDQIKKSETVKKDTQEKLVNFKKAYESALQAQQWDADLKTLAAKDIVQRFQGNIKKMEENSLALKNNREAFETARTNAEDIRKKLKSLKDPMLRLAEDESSGQKQNILKTLYQFAGMEFPAESGTAKLSSDAEVKPPNKEAAAPATEAYQNLLSMRIRMITERQKYSAELLNALNLLNQKIEPYTSVLTETNKLAVQNYANAVELKKRLGRKELEENDIPEGITDALKRDRITKIETDLAELLNYQTRVRQEIEPLGKPDQTLQESHTLLTGILGSVGKRIDILNALTKLNQDFERKTETLSKTEQTAVEQKALKLSKSEDKPEEFFIEFVPSEHSANLTKLIQAYYQEMIGLQNQQENLKSQKEKTEYLIRLAEDEKTAILKFLPFIQKYAEQLENMKKEEQVKIQAQLMPQKAEEILGKFESETGKRLSMPAPIAEKDRTSAIEKFADILFNDNAEILSLKKWIRLFEQRLSPSGLGVEIGKYQDNLGAMTAKDSAVQRRIKQLTGHSQNELTGLSPEEKLQTETDNIRFLKGEIGMLRADRYKICVQAALLTFANLAVIFVITAILLRLINSFTGRRIRREQEAGEQSNQTIVVYSLMRSSFKLMVWAIAMLAVLHSMGFNIGAILAGLGIGGLAVAMAAKDTLANMLGGVMIFVSKPFKVGDLIKIKGSKGIPEEAYVREIGIRSTRMEQAPCRTVYTVPNSVFSESIIENITAWQGKYVMETLKLSRKTSAKQMESALQLIRNILSNHKEINNINRVILQRFDDYAYVIEYVYNIAESKKGSVVRSEVNLEIHKQLEENSINFAELPIELRNLEEVKTITA